jgi:vacuolar-type H+-ATPase subunit C/Vma6
MEAAFAEVHGEGEGLTRMEKMNYRHELASSLVETTYKHLVDGLKERAQDDHQRALKEWSLRLDDIGEAEDMQL